MSKIRFGLHDDRKEYRTNLWTIVFYPEDSAPDNYLSYLSNLHIPMLLSPLHDKDKNGNGLEKKKHMHLLIDFGAGQKKSYNQVQKIAKYLGVNECDYVDSRNALVRYFIHADNPEKYQYKREDLIALSGFNWIDSFNGIDEETKLYNNIEKLIKDLCVYNMANLVDLLKDLNFNYELQFLRKHTLYFNCLLNGRYQLMRNSLIINNIDNDKNN